MNREFDSRNIIIGIIASTLAVLVTLIFIAPVSARLNPKNFSSKHAITETEITANAEVTFSYAGDQTLNELSQFRRFDMPATKNGSNIDDLNGDGIADIFGCRKNERSTSCFILSLPKIEAFPQTQPTKKSNLITTWEEFDNKGKVILGHFDTSSKQDLAWIGQNGSLNTWKLFLSSAQINDDTQTAKAFSAAKFFTYGSSDALALLGDFDGDNLSDLAVYDKKTAIFQTLLSSGDYNLMKALLSKPGFGISAQLGRPGDLPFILDMNRDRQSDIVLFRAPSTFDSKGFWQINYSSKNSSFETKEEILFGGIGDTPLIADITCDGEPDLVTYNPLSGRWILHSKDAVLKSFPWKTSRTSDHQTSDPLTTGSLTASPQTATASSNPQALLADFDGDTCADFAFLTDTSLEFIASRSFSPIANRPELRNPLLVRITWPKLSFDLAPGRLGLPVENFVLQNLKEDSIPIEPIEILHDAQS